MKIWRAPQNLLGPSPTDVQERFRKRGDDSTARNENRGERLIAPA